MTHRILVALIVSLLAVATAHAATAFLVGEQVTGMTKQCFYDFAGSTYTRTVPSYALCPLTIEVR